MDDDDPLAERGDVGHVVAGQQDGRAGAAVVFLQEVADARLGGDVQADGRLIEEEHPGPVQQPGGQLAFHALAQREVAHRFAHDRCQLEQLVQLFQGALVLGVGEAVDRLVEQEGIGRGDIPREAVALAHHQGHRPQVVRLALPGGKAQHVGLPAGGVKQAGEHLQGGRFAGAVRPEEADDLPLLDREAHLLDSLHIFIFALEKTAHGRAKAALALGHLVGLAQFLDGDGLIHSIDILT